MKKILWFSYDTKSKNFLECFSHVFAVIVRLDFGHCMRTVDIDSFGRDRLWLDGVDCRACCICDIF